MTNGNGCWSSGTPSATGPARPMARSSCSRSTHRQAGCPPLRPVAPAHPGRRLLPLAALAVLAVAIELLALPAVSWTGRLVGSNALVCLVAIPTLAIVPLAAVLAILRSGAPASPALAGGAAGLLAAAAAAALYAFHCFDDSPLFVVTWYALAALPVIALGAVAGHRLLRW